MRKLHKVDCPPDCGRRAPGCQSTCTRYKLARLADQGRKRREWERKRGLQTVDSAAAEGKRRARRHWRSYDKK